MKILIVTTRFYPYGSATSGVVGNLADALNKLGHDVEIVALTRYKDDAVCEKWNNVFVQKFYSAALITKEQIKKEFKKYPFRCIHGLLEKIYDKLYCLFNNEYGVCSLKRSMVKKYKRALELSLKDKYDLCIVTLMPIEAVRAAIEFDFEETQLAIYQLDPYWNNADYPPQYTNERFKLESYMVRHCAFCMTTPLIAEENVKQCPDLKDKYIITEFPCLRPIDCTNIPICKDSVVHCVFLGTLYPELRPPENLVSVISKIANKDVVFDFYGSGQYLVEQSRDYKNAKSKIRLHGQIDSKTAELVRASADILVNIDNTSTALVPSKIFEYISTGKTIINCYFSNKSRTIDYLERYPLCVNICLNDDYLLGADKIDKLLCSYSGEVIPFETVRNMYYKNTPDYVANQVLETFYQNN